MRIGILTQPLNKNFGGILQAFALQTVLRQLGHKSWIIPRHRPKPIRGRFSSKFSAIYNILRQLLQQLLKTRSATQPSHIFIKEHIRQSYSSSYTIELKLLMRLLRLNAFIVGSDQVWRPCYSPNLENYFLDFIPTSSKVKRISYAASFGVDNWEFSKTQSRSCSILAKRFNAISVRESSAVDLCSTFLGVDAEHVLDPTMLIDNKIYDSLCALAQSSDSDSPYIADYILDNSREKSQTIELAKESLQIPIKHINSPMTIEQWLAFIKNCQLLITDSFHGVAFAIIFNRPFCVFNNEQRGNARIDSLLSMFELEDRTLITHSVIDLINNPINWSAVNAKRKTLVKRSINFLQKALTD